MPNLSVKNWLNTVEGKTPLALLERSVANLQCTVDEVSFEDLLEHLEILLAAMQIAAGKEAEFAPTAEEVQNTVDYVEEVDGECLVYGLEKSILDAFDVVTKWQMEIAPNDEDDDSDNEVPKADAT